VLTTDQKGAIAESAILHAAIERGIGVYVPFGDERLRLDLRPATGARARSGQVGSRSP
jgi:hypothetical protein